MRRATLRFVRHYAEMVGAMYAGMLLIVPLAAALTVLDLELRDEPTLHLAAMGVVMTVPMVAWMRYRGHGWAPCADMTAAMLVPTLGVLVLLWTGAVEGVDTLLVVEHVVMLPSMLVAMLLRRGEYTGAHRHAVAA
jgi:hypothetical protein